MKNGGRSGGIFSMSSGVMLCESPENTSISASFPVQCVQCLNQQDANSVVAENCKKKAIPRISPSLC
jgi:hypothetical protein